MNLSTQVQMNKAEKLQKVATPLHDIVRMMGTFEFHLSTQTVFHLHPREV